ncbi:GNAT family N-acetyltransferase [Psychrobacillus lasiicapitis]|uniref:GNAT family N-acetyltransferase n=1 Tax=Psychrobacillus lasiicapitis TaxID=1636719 RepID=UPI00147683EA|nr:N-acetyltransferase [Psychrobacillus lasiicapitis]
MYHEFSDADISQSFVVAYDEENLIGALGFDVDKESKSAEVWGPFIKNKGDYQLADSLWEKANALLTSEVNEFSFFINIKNEFVQQFAIHKNAINKGNHLLLKAFHNDLEEVDLAQIESYDLAYRDSFMSLHKKNFPNTYFKASEILDRLSNHNHLLVINEKEGRIKGYVYVEANPEHKEGSIEYITVAADYQKQGIGTLLIRAALSYLFSINEIEEISLSVAKEKDKAKRLYKAAGFKKVHELIHYQLKE